MRKCRDTALGVFVDLLFSLLLCDTLQTLLLQVAHSFYEKKNNKCLKYGDTRFARDSLLSPSCV